MVMTAANAYLGMKVGMTVSASIPAAVISMGVLSLFKNSNIRENNIVQTAASAGEFFKILWAALLTAISIQEIIWPPNNVPTTFASCGITN